MIIMKKLISPYRKLKLLSELFTKDHPNTRKKNITVILSDKISTTGGEAFLEVKDILLQKQRIHLAHKYKKHKFVHI